jgi:hypothetical protein
MKSIEDVLKDAPVGPYKGSEATYIAVKAQIEDRFGPEEAERYDPFLNCLSFKEWTARGFRVKRGEKSIKSLTIVEREDEKGKVRHYPRTVHLFYHLQVEPIQEEKK